MKTGNVTFSNFKENSPTSNFIRKPHYYTLGKGKNQTKESLTFPTEKMYKDIKRQLLKRNYKWALNI